VQRDEPLRLEDVEERRVVQRERLLSPAGDGLGSERTLMRGVSSRISAGVTDVAAAQTAPAGARTIRWCRSEKSEVRTNASSGLGARSSDGWSEGRV
jgi:hypothetical protein